MAIAPLFRIDGKDPPWLVRLGQGSLLAYAFHIPFCYGRLARPLAHRLNMLQASLWLLALGTLTYGVVLARDRYRMRRGG